MLPNKYKWILDLSLDDIKIILKHLGEINRALEHNLSSSSVVYRGLVDEKSEEEKIEEQLNRILDEERKLEKEEMKELHEEVKLIARVRGVIHDIKRIEEAVNYFIYSWKLYKEGRDEISGPQFDAPKVSALDEIPQVEREVEAIRKKVLSLKERHGLLEKERDQVKRATGRGLEDDTKSNWFLKMFNVIESDLVEAEKHLGALKKEFHV